MHKYLSLFVFTFFPLISYSAAGYRPISTTNFFFNLVEQSPLDVAAAIEKYFSTEGYAQEVTEPIVERRVIDNMTVIHHALGRKRPDIAFLLFSLLDEEQRRRISKIYMIENITTKDGNSRMLIDSIFDRGLRALGNLRKSSTPPARRNMSFEYWVAMFAEFFKLTKTYFFGEEGVLSKRQIQLLKKNHPLLCTPEFEQVLDVLPLTMGDRVDLSLPLITGEMPAR